MISCNFLSLVVLLFRHPDNSSRPKFSGLKSTLSQADETLLKVPFTKGEHHPLAFVLGSTVNAGHTLYPDLQTMYISHANDYVYECDYMT